MMLALMAMLLMAVVLLSVWSDTLVTNSKRLIMSLIVRILYLSFGACSR